MKNYWRLKKQIPDQLAHFAWSFVALAPVLIWPSWWAGGLSGFLIAAPREFWDQGEVIDSWPDTLLDIAFFILGGMCVGGLID